MLDENNNVVQKYMDIFSSNGLVIFNNISPKFATRIDVNSNAKTIIDHILTDIINTSYCLSTCDHFKTDNRLLLLQIRNNNIPPPTQILKKVV